LSAELKEALSHRTEVIEDNSQLQAQEGANPIIDSKITRDIKTINNANDQSISESLEEIKSKVDQTARSQIYAEMRPYLTGVSDGYLRVRTCKARKINKLFSYEYDPVTLKKIDEQVKSKIATSPVNKISETVATTSANDPSDDNFSDTSDITDYFKEEGVNDLIEEDSKKSGIIAKADNDDDVYFYSEDEEVKEVNEEIPKVSSTLSDCEVTSSFVSFTN
ncbi:3935_t:CDS:2, partial [Funneliformis geosporum]